MKILSNSQYNNMLEEIGRLQELSISQEKETARVNARFLEKEQFNVAVLKELNERNSKLKAENERLGKIIAELTANFTHRLGSRCKGPLCQNQETASGIKRCMSLPQ